jgi:hypothetical protein
MIRQNKDGRPIYNNKTWYRMLEIGKKLERLGYRESNNKPNLYYKVFDNQNNGDRGLVFADMRGTVVIPIWDDSRPLLYYKNLTFMKFLPEFISLERAGCHPRVSFYEECEPGGWLFHLDKTPSGYCKRCGEDILFKVNWEILREDMFDLYNKGLSAHYEVNFCDTCRTIEYAKKQYRAENTRDYNVCELCGIGDAELDHHIIYKTEVKIRICRSCHGKIHKFGKNFPNPLWKEKKEKLETKIE